jgi:hypothetical protein
MVNEELVGIGEVLGVDRQLLARVSYNLRVKFAVDGQEMVHLALQPTDEASVLGASGRLTLRLEDKREVDFVLVARLRSDRYVPVVAFKSVRAAPTPD